MKKIYSHSILISIIYSFFFILLFAVYNFDISQFAQFSNLTDQNRIPFKINPIDRTGYDGQFYIRLALNPFELNWPHDNLPETNPSYRYSRIGYPLILWIFSFLFKEYIIYLSVLINIIGILFIYFINRLNFEILGIDKKLSIFCAFLPGYYFVISRATCEIYEIVFISLSILFFLRNKLILFSFCVFFSFLIRETAFIFYLIIIFLSFFSNLNIKKQYLFIPFLLYLFWQFCLYIFFGNIPFGTGVNTNFSTPLLGIIEIFNFPRYQNNIFQGITYVTEYIYIFFIIFLCIFSFKSHHYKDFLFLSFIAYLIYFLLLNEVVLGTDWGFMRILLELNYLSTIIILRSKKIKLFLIKISYTAINIFVFLRIFIEQSLKYNFI